MGAREDCAGQVEVEDLALPRTSGGYVVVRIFRPRDVGGTLPVTLYLQGADEVDGGADQTARALSAERRVAVLAPPTSALQEIYDVLRWVANDGHRRRLDGARIELAGDPALIAAVRRSADERPGPPLTGH